MIDVPPIWRVLQAPRTDDRAGGRVDLVVPPGAGFGTGDHETSQLCLQAIHWLRPAGARSWRLLDFGSGSGILSIAAARLGASVEAVEIDPLAIEHGRQNAGLNRVEDRIRYSRTLAEVSGHFDLVVANILSGVLLEAAEDLTSRVVANGALALSGLVATDVPRVIARYTPLLGQRRPTVYERGAWRLLSWKVA